MGLCKCERKKVTNLFCFEHRVNVCEFCLISNHPKCVVKSYLHWLKDSDYSSQCLLCAKELDSGEECVRLMCLDNYASQLPPNTAPAGYECPSCSMGIIPHANQGGPIAETLRQRLTSAKWVKPNRQTKVSAPKSKSTLSSRTNDTFTVFDDSKLLDSSVDTYASQFLNDQEMVTLPTTPSPKRAETIIPIEYPSTNVSNGPVTSRLDSNPPLPKLNNPRNLLVDDEDIDKYRPHYTPVSKSGSTIFRFTRCISSIVPQSLFRRRLSFIFGVIIFICLMLILITNLMVNQSLPEDNLRPVRVHLPVGI
ncbi:hypothetical protein Aperf_G00000101575 [Anoplocephala perfoliata]